MRELVKVLAIESLEDAENSDSLSICKFTDSGWQVVVKKGEFEIGQCVLFIEIDSVLPKERPEFEFLTKGTKDYRLRTIKLRGNLSQGLAIDIPIDILNILDFGTDEASVNLAELLGIKLYEPIVNMNSGTTKGGFPSYIIPRTDQERIQNVKCIIPELINKQFWKTTKMDGKSATFLWIDDEFNCCSHNCNVNRDENNEFWYIAKKYRLEEILPKHLAIQGELCGGKIQKNNMGCNDYTLFVFDIFNTETHKYVDFDVTIEICRLMELPIVPHELITFDENTTLESILESANEVKYSNGAQAEGIVYRTKKEDWHRKLGRFSFKVISNNYLLKEQ